jgi:hypothetical protein
MQTCPASEKIVNLNRIGLRFGSGLGRLAAQVCAAYQEAAQFVIIKTVGYLRQSVSVKSCYLITFSIARPYLSKQRPDLVFVHGTLYRKST